MAFLDGDDSTPDLTKAQLELRETLAGKRVSLLIKAIFHPHKTISHAVNTSLHSDKTIFHAVKAIFHSHKTTSHASKTISHSRNAIFHTIKVIFHSCKIISHA